jgi:hypothetical protein
MERDYPSAFEIFLNTIHDGFDLNDRSSTANQEIVGIGYNVGNLKKYNILSLLINHDLSGC